MSQGISEEPEAGAIAAAWRLLGDTEGLRDPITPGNRLTAESKLGRSMPPDLLAVYAVTDGFYGLGGNLQIETSIIAAESAGQLREWGWPVPADAIVFGNNGSDDQYALLFLDEPPNNRSVVVSIGAIFEEDCLAIAGTSLARFLLTMTGFYMAQQDAPPAAMDAIGLPAELRAAHSVLEPYVRWADPALPYSEPDPYDQRLTPAQVRDLLG